MPLDRIPWARENVPKALVSLVESGKVRPCRAVDLGCGAGVYAIWFAQKGFDVTGVDISPTAIGIAREKAAKAGVSCRFVIADPPGIPGRSGEPSISDSTGSFSIISCPKTGRRMRGTSLPS